MVERPQVVPPKQTVTQANALELLGGIVLSVGLGFIHPWIGIVAFGVTLFAVGFLMEWT